MFLSKIDEKIRKGLPNDRIRGLDSGNNLEFASQNSRTPNDGSYLRYNFQPCITSDHSKSLGHGKSDLRFETESKPQG